MPRIIDLDVVAPEDTIVVIGGEEYTLPGDIPVPHMLAIERAASEFFADDEDTTERLLALQAQVLKLFRIRQPDMDELPPLGLAGLIQFVQAIYGPPEDEPDPPRPAPKRRSGTTSSRKPKATRTRSGS